jgi:uncharacterized membrane protein YkgB
LVAEADASRLEALGHDVRLISAQYVKPFLKGHKNDYRDAEAIAEAVQRYPLFGVRGASWFLGVSEWLFGALLFLGFWNKRLGILGAIGSIATFVGTVTIIPFMPNGWDPVAGFPAMAGNVPFLMKDVVLLAVSIYLLKQDVQRVLEAGARTNVSLSQA